MDKARRLRLWTEGQRSLSGIRLLCRLPVHVTTLAFFGLAVLCHGRECGCLWTLLLATGIRVTMLVDAFQVPGYELVLDHPILQLDALAP